MALDERRPVPRRTSFRGKITAAILLTAVAVMFFCCALFMIEQQRMDLATGRSNQRRMADFLASVSAPAVSAGREDRPVELLSALKIAPLVRWAEIRDVNGVVLARYAGPATASPPVMSVTAPIVFASRKVGEITLRQGAPAPSLVLPRYFAMGGALFFAAIALALFLGRWLAGRISEPVARLSEMMDEVGRSGDFARRIEPSANDELGRLTENFNGLLTALHGNDMALRNTMRELVAARDAAQAANVQKSQFLANMSHEIRTPLNGVLAMAQILAHGDLKPSQREQVDVIRTSGESLLEILNDILDVSKIEAGKFELETFDFDLEELAQGVQASFSALAERKMLGFSLEIAEGARGVRRGDGTRLRQILNNFVSNGLKFTDEGAVRLTIDGDGDNGADGLHIAVFDTGIGIATEKQSLLFHKFSQLDASTTRRFGGTGLGLAICHELAALMGGQVWVESELDQGSVFHARLPLARVGDAKSRAPEPESEPATVAAAAAAPSPHDAAEAPGEPESATDAEPAEGRLRVLAAEDNPTNQLVLTTVMQIFGIDLVIVQNGLEAVEAWERESFDVILMDIQMPVMDGMAATIAIRAAEAATGRPRIPILALSANALVHQVRDYLAAGMDAHVAKPIELTKLQAALETALTPSEDVAAA